VFVAINLLPIFSKKIVIIEMQPVASIAVLPSMLMFIAYRQLQVGCQLKLIAESQVEC